MQLAALSAGPVQSCVGKESCCEEKVATGHVGVTTNLLLFCPSYTKMSSSMPYSHTF